MTFGGGAHDEQPQSAACGFGAVEGKCLQQLVVHAGAVVFDGEGPERVVFSKADGDPG